MAVKRNDMYVCMYVCMYVYARALEDTAPTVLKVWLWPAFEP